MAEKKADMLPVLKQQSESFAPLLAFEITNDEELAQLSDKLKEIKNFGKAAKAEMEKLTDPAKAIIEQAKTTYQPFITQAKQYEDVLKAKGVKYTVAKNAAIQVEKNKIAARVETGSYRPETALRKQEELPQQTKTADTGFSKFQVKEVQDIEIFDESLIPEEYWIRTLDTKKIRTVAISAKIEVPGVRVITKHQGASL